MSKMPGWKDGKRAWMVRAVITITVFTFILSITNVLFAIATRSSARPSVSADAAAAAYVFYQTPINKGKIALTFDDGPNQKATRDIAQVLKREQVPATFFFIGRNMLILPGIVKQVHEDGFDIENHSFTHSVHIQSSPERLKAELVTTEYLIYVLTGKTPNIYRPPFLLSIGEDPTINPYIPPVPEDGWPLTLGYLPVGIDIDPKDWSATTSEAVARSALKEAPNGHIMLLHDTPHTLQALPTVITELRNAGYRFVSLDEVLFPPERIALSRDLHLGDTDQATTTDVSLLQWFLYTQGYFDLYNISGTFDTDTDEALLQYKIVEHLADPTDITPLSSQLDASTRAHIALTQLPSVRSELATSTPHQGLTMTAIQKRGGVLFVDTLAFTVTALTALIMVAVGFLLFRFLFIVTLLSIAAYKKRRNRAVLVQVPKSRPPVTVLIPAWNESSNIRATIRSVHSQLRPKDQILVIDDGSTDDTGAIVLEYIKKERAYRKIKLLQKQNGGKAAALNYGIAHAKNKIIITLDADSIFGPETIDHLARHFTDPKVGAVGGKVYTTNKKTFINRMQALEYMIGQNIEKRAFTTINAVGVVPGPVGAWKKEALHEINGFSTDTLVEDQDATIAVLSKGYRIVYEPHAVAYTETPASIEQFLKQRFRWIFGTFQCFLKYKGIFIRAPFSNVSLIVLPNIVIYNVFVPLLFPIIDTILIVSIFTGLGGVVFLQVLLFTVVDVLYALVATLGEKRRFEYVPVMVVARFLYRQLIYYTVVRSLIRLLEGVHLAWNPLKRIGDAERFFLSKLAESAKPTTN